MRDVGLILAGMLAVSAASGCRQSTRVAREAARLAIEPKGAPTEPAQQKAPPLVVRIASDGFAIDGVGASKRVGRAGAGYDFAGLAKTLTDVKERYPELTGLTLEAEKGVSYETVVRTMDVAMQARLSDVQLR